VSEHAPKLAALIAYDGGVLSDAGAARVERHLASCAPCRVALAQGRAYEQAAEEARRARYPEPDWQKMDLALARVAREEARRARGGPSSALWAVAALAAAALLAVWAASRGGSPTTPELPPAPPIAEHVRPVAPPAMFAEVTAVSGEARAAGLAEPLAPGSSLAEGTRLVTGAGARLDVALRDATGIVLAEQSATVITRLRAEETELTLEAGAVSSQVHHLAAAERYEVRAGRYLISVRGTRFTVTRDGERITVTCDEGVVAVSDGDREVALVRAPGRWSSSPDVEALAQGSVPRPRAIDPAAAAWPTLRLPALANIREWRFDGSKFTAAGELAARVPLGTLSLVGVDDRGRELGALIEVTTAGAVLEGSALQPTTPEIRTGYLPRALINPVVAAGTPAMRRCTDLTLNIQPNLALGDARLRLTVTGNGEVERVSVTGDGWDMPLALAACIQRNVERWNFPPPTGGAVPLVLPIHLVSGH